MIKENSELFPGNKLIAEFMGYEYLPLNTRLPQGKKVGWNSKMKWTPFVETSGMFSGNPPEKFYLGRSHHNLMFHRDWSWLMPVVERIENLKLKYRVTVSISGGGCRITSDNHNLYGKDNRLMLIQNHEHADKTKIIRTWEAIVAFIEWYNENIKK